MPQIYSSLLFQKAFRSRRSLIGAEQWKLDNIDELHQEDVDESHESLEASRLENR